MTDTVLIVDDSLTVRMNLIELLRTRQLAGRRVRNRGGGETRAGQDTFCLVILDVLLPDGDGIELLKEIRAMPPGTVPPPSCCCRPRPRSTIASAALSTGADEYVGKPYDTGYVVARARELVRRSSEPEPQSQETILVIDDSVTFREALKSALGADVLSRHRRRQRRRGLARRLRIVRPRRHRRRRAAGNRRRDRDPTHPPRRGPARDCRASC